MKPARAQHWSAPPAMRSCAASCFVKMISGIGTLALALFAWASFRGT